MISNEEFLLHQITGLLRNSPNKHIVHYALNKPDIVIEEYYIYFESAEMSRIGPIIDFDDHQIYKVMLTVDLVLNTRINEGIETPIKNLKIDLYTALEKNEYLYRDLLFSVDDLLFYVNNLRNQKVSKTLNFAALTPCELPQASFNYIDNIRQFQALHFTSNTSPVLDLYFEDEFNDLFAIASNSLANLYRMSGRVIEELEDIPYGFSKSGFNIYPRFNNAISEVAGNIYNFWERIAFVLNEFYPIKNSHKNPPSFKKYILEKVQQSKSNNFLKNKYLNWFDLRIQKEHLNLETLRHPTIHYNKSSTPSGLRTIELRKNSQNDPDKIRNAWKGQLFFLKNELSTLSEGTEYCVRLLYAWAETGKLN